MTQLFGVVTLDDVSTFADTRGQQLVYSATTEYLAMVNADMLKAISIFVEGETENFKERYQLPGGGRLQRRGLQSQPGAVKASGYWDVAYPLEDFAAAIAGDDVTLAYTTVQEYQRHVETVIIQDQNTVRFEILRRLFKNTTDTFVDPLKGSLTIQPLANADSVTYPPIMGSESEATDTLYLESGYAASAISDTNNYVATMVTKFTNHFGNVTGGRNVAIFINTAQQAKTAALTTFHDVIDINIRAGANTDVPINMPNVPGRIVGRMDEGAWIIVWDWVPSGYALAVDLDAPPPLKMRVDEARTGLGRGLQLVTTDFEMPYRTAFWRHRFGFGVGNRLNGCVMEFGTGGTYTIPTAYQ